MGSARHAGGVSQRPARAVSKGDGLQPDSRFHVRVICRWKSPPRRAAHCFRHYTLIHPWHHVQRLIQARCHQKSSPIHQSQLLLSSNQHSPIHPTLTILLHAILKPRHSHNVQPPVHPVLHRVLVLPPATIVRKVKEPASI